MFGNTRYFLAEHAAAAANLKRAIAAYAVERRNHEPIRYGTDILSNDYCYQAVTSWSLGFAEKGYRAGRDAIREARGADNPVALCIALLAHSSVMLLKMGYLEEAERCIDELIDHSEEHSLTPYHAHGLCAKGSLMAARGDAAEAERLLHLGLQRSREVAYKLFEAHYQGELGAVLGSSGGIDEGLAEVDAAIRYAERSESLWCLPELMRIKGELLTRSPGAAHLAEGWFLRSLELARKQQALAWELRAALSMARLWLDGGRAEDANSLLHDTYRRFTEGFDCADLREARTLMKQST